MWVRHIVLEDIPMTNRTLAKRAAEESVVNASGYMIGHAERRRDVLPSQADVEAPVQCDEARRVALRRFREARDAGLTLVESKLFADSGVDVGLLRACVKGDCKPQLIARILV